MKLLGVESSSPYFSVAVSDGPEVLAHRQVEGQGRPSALLTDLIQEALREGRLELGQMDGFAVSIGPGSFTGLRVGVMTVKALAWALKKPVVPVSSLEVLAHGAVAGAVAGAGGGATTRLGSQEIDLFLDARKGNVYWAQFRRNGNGVTRVSPDELLRPEEALRRVRPPALLVGDGLRRYADLVVATASTPQRLARADESLWIPRADFLCRIAHSRWPEGIVDDPHRLVPEYLYSKESGITGR